jgi:FkbM family methyltransferase
MSSVSGRNGLVDKKRKAAFILAHEGLAGLARLLWDAICVRAQAKILLPFVYIDARSCKAKVISSQKRRGLFIDCGSNLGQGFTYFCKHYSLKLYDYILIEPNPNCLLQLTELRAKLSGNIQIIGEAASTNVGEVQFYGLTEGGRGETSELGSTLSHHNSKFYVTDEKSAIRVRTFSLSDLIKSRHLHYASIVLKLDIEGAEYDVLDDMIVNKAHLYVDRAYVEFHSQYMSEPMRSLYRVREKKIMHRLRQDGVRFRLWV